MSFFLAGPQKFVIPRLDFYDFDFLGISGTYEKMKNFRTNHDSGNFSMTLLPDVNIGPTSLPNPVKINLDLKYGINL